VFGSRLYLGKLCNEQFVQLCCTALTSFTGPNLAATGRWQRAIGSWPAEACFSAAASVSSELKSKHSKLKDVKEKARQPKNSSGNNVKTFYGRKSRIFVLNYECLSLASLSILCSVCG
jgi:hypothetical protein